MNCALVPDMLLQRCVDAMQVDRVFVGKWAFYAALHSPFWTSSRVFRTDIQCLMKKMHRYYSGNPFNELGDERIADQGTVKCVDHVLPLFAGS